MDVDLGGMFSLLQLSITMNVAFSTVTSFYEKPIQKKIDLCKIDLNDCENALKTKKISENLQKKLLKLKDENKKAWELAKKLSIKLDDNLYNPCRYISILFFLLSLSCMICLLFDRHLIENDYFIFLTILSLIPPTIFSIIYSIVPIAFEVYTWSLSRKTFEILKKIAIEE